jgi:predicted O-methyltransferase YrrM
MLGHMLPPGQMELPESSAAARGLRLTAGQIAELRPSERLACLLAGVAAEQSRVDWKTLFYMNGHRLPCLIEQDLAAADDPWLTAPNNYPAYFALFKILAAGLERVRMLEIGVRTGYVAAVFAQAVAVPALYVGVDPNRYVADGMEKAGATLRLLRQRQPSFDGVLIEGYSWEERIHRTLRDTGPFDWVHIDGHHVLDVKLHDIELAAALLAPGGLALVDDFDSIACISDAVKRAMTVGLFKEFHRLPTYRGLAVLRA